MDADEEDDEDEGESEDENGDEIEIVNGFRARYNYSFEAKLAMAADDMKDYYRRIVAFARSYGVKVSRSWSRERVHIGRQLFACLVFRGSKLSVAFALDPKAYEDTKYVRRT